MRKRHFLSRTDKTAGRVFICLLCVLLLAGQAVTARAESAYELSAEAADGGDQGDPSGEGGNGETPGPGSGGTQTPDPGPEPGSEKETEKGTEKESEKEAEKESEKESEPESETESGNETESESETETEDGSVDVTNTSSNVVLMAMNTRLPAGKLVVVDGEVRYMLASGALLKDTWAKIGNGIYHFEKDGAASTGLYEFGRYSYYFDDSGKLLINRFLKTGEDKYFFGDDGRMVTNEWVKASRTKRYYALSDGKLARSMWVRERYFDDTGLYSYRKGTRDTGTYQDSTAKRRLIIVGASRSWHMQLAVGNKKGIIWIVSPGKNIKWMKSTAMPKLRQKLKKYPNSQVVIQMGNNDVKHHQADAAFADYRKIYQSLLKKYKKASFYFMDVLPMKDLNCRRNRRAVRFNELLKKAFPRQYIGGYEYLLEDGYTNSYDGVHYNVDTSRKIFDYILSKIDSRRENGQKESGL